MIRAIIEQTFDQQKKYVILAGRSTDGKPTTGIITGSKFEEVNTGIVYAFDEVSGSWSAVGLSPAEIKAEIDAWLDEHPEATTTVEDGAITYAKLDSSLQAMADKVPVLEEEMATKANVDGYYEQMTVGNAEQLVSTVGVEDKVPYLFRTSGGSADIGNREVDMVVGGTVAWNQLQANTVSKTSSGVTFSYSNGELTISGEASANVWWLVGTDTKWDFYKDHVYFVEVGNKDYTYEPTNHYWYFPSGFGVGNTYILNPSAVLKCVSPTTTYLQVQVINGTNIQTPIKYKPQLFDLTQMFGSTIADYIYSLEQATPGAGVAFFRKLFPKPYYAYNPGELMSVQTSAHKLVGFNAWDEQWENGTFNTTTGVNIDTQAVLTQIRSKNLIPIVGGQSYFVTVPSTLAQYTQGAWVMFLDENKNIITSGLPNGDGSSGYCRLYRLGKFTAPDNARYIKFYMTYEYGSTYNHDICINLSWDGERDGEYEPYTVHSYALDSDLELRGIPKLDANNALYYDGDTYESDGTVTRRYGIVDLGTLNWSAGWAGYYTSGIQIPISSYSEVGNIICSKYPSIAFIDRTDKTISAIYGGSGYGSNGYIYIKDTAYESADAFKTSLSGVYLVYELATPTTETADPYQNPQIVDDFGTEEYTDTRAVAIPVGHVTEYQNNLRAKLEMSPESPSGDGDYIVRQTNGENVYVPLTFPADELPAAPTTDGDYRLKCTVADGSATFTWEAIE